MFYQSCRVRVEPSPAIVRSLTGNHLLCEEAILGRSFTDCLVWQSEVFWYHRAEGKLQPDDTCDRRWRASPSDITDNQV